MQAARAEADTVLHRLANAPTTQEAAGLVEGRPPCHWVFNTVGGVIVEQAELKVRAIFIFAALVAFLAVAVHLFSLFSGQGKPWVALLVPAFGLLLAALEAFGIQKVGANVPVRLLVSVLVGVSCLALLET